MNRYALNGLSVDSAMELGKPSLATFADLTLAVGDTAPVPESVPAGELLAEFALDGRPIYSAADDGRHFVLRLHELCDFVVEHDLARAECRPADGADPEILALVVRGALSAFVLGLRGEASLHASAVDWRAGFSGQRSARDPAGRRCRVGFIGAGGVAGSGVGRRPVGPAPAGDDF